MSVQLFQLMCYGTRLHPSIQNVIFPGRPAARRGCRGWPAPCPAARGFVLEKGSAKGNRPKTSNHIVISPNYRDPAQEGSRESRGIGLLVSPAFQEDSVV